MNFDIALLQQSVVTFTWLRDENQGVFINHNPVVYKKKSDFLLNTRKQQNVTRPPPPPGLNKEKEISFTLELDQNNIDISARGEYFGPSL